MWEYAEAGRIITLRSVYATRCIFCGFQMLRFFAQKFEVGAKRLLAQPSICMQCGWWTVYRVHQGEIAETSGLAESYSGTIGSLKEFDLKDISAPVDEIRKYLLAKKEAIFEVHPRILEQVVCGVFADLGWKARATIYSGDDGVDVILEEPSGASVGVQVKRNKKNRKIEAEQIRSLAGALLINGHTKGIFVTTSSFRKGAHKTAKKFGSIGFPIELVDAEGFLKALGISQVKSFNIDRKRMNSCVLSSGIHIGTGIEKQLTEGENLYDRLPVIKALIRDEFIDLYENRA